MNRIFATFVILTLGAALAFAADTNPASMPGLQKSLEQNISMVEKEIVSLAEAMPAGKYDFAPTAGEFKGVRTFAQQMKHVAAVNYVMGASILEEKNPSDSGKDENGPASVSAKDDIVKYLKESFAYVHKAVGTLTDSNLNGMVKSPFGSGKASRASLAMVPTWHAFDHYGQAVVYARMNGIVPPASR